MAAPPGRERVPFQIQPGARQFAGWAEQMSSSGRLYYYNRKTEVSTWEKPQEWKEYEDKGGIIESGHSTPGSAERRPGSGDRLEKNKGGVNEKPRFAFQPPSLPPPPMAGPHLGFMGGPPPPHQQYMHYGPPPGVAPHFYNQPPPPPPPGAYYPMRGNFYYRVPPPPFAVNVPPPNVVPPPPPPPAPRAPSVSTGVPPPPPPPPPPQRTPRTPGNPMYSSPRDGGYPMGGGAPPPPPPPPPPPMDAPGAHKSSSGMTVSPRTPSTSRTPTESLYKTGVNMMNQQRVKRSPPGPPPKELSAKRRFDEPPSRQSRSDRISIDGGPRSPELVNPPPPIIAPPQPLLAPEAPPTPQKKQDQSFMDRLKKIPFLTPEMLELFDEEMANEAAVKLNLQDDEERKLNAQTRRHSLAMENSGRCKLHALTLMGYTKRALEHKTGLLALRASCLDKMINALTEASMAPRDKKEAGIQRTSPSAETPAEVTPANTPAN